MYVTGTVYIPCGPTYRKASPATVLTYIGPQTRFLALASPRRTPVLFLRSHQTSRKLPASVASVQKPCSRALTPARLEALPMLTL